MQPHVPDLLCYVDLGSVDEVGYPSCQHRVLEKIAHMMDVIVENEASLQVVQVRGGEPTVQPQFFESLELAKERPIQHLMINTNEVKIATDRAFLRMAQDIASVELLRTLSSAETVM